MLRNVASLCLAIFIVFFSPIARAAALPPVEAPAEPVRVAAAASALATVTGIAISPLLGTGAYGAYKYISAADPGSRSSLPWFALPGFFIPALIISGLCAAKDIFGVVFPPGLKKPLDALELIENKFSGLIAAGAVLPITLSTLGSVLVGPTAMLHGSGFPPGLAVLSIGSVTTPWLVNVLIITIGLLIFGVVWMASHAINVLILLSPWGTLDAALKAARTVVLGAITLAAEFDPKIAGALCLVVIVAAYAVSGWAFRLTVFGTIFSWDILTGRRHRLSVAAASHRVFSSKALTAQKVPLRTYGQLIVDPDGRRCFRYRPWLILPMRETEVVESELMIGRGVFFSTVTADGLPLFILPPRYSGHEERIARHYGFAGVEDAGLRKVWSALKEALGRRAVATMADS